MSMLVVVLAGVVVFLLVAIVGGMVAVAMSGRVERGEAIAVIVVGVLLLLCCGVSAAGLVYGLFGFNVMRPAPAPVMTPHGARDASKVLAGETQLTYLDTPCNHHQHAANYHVLGKPSIS
jgi:hypothetical protein